MRRHLGVMLRILTVAVIVQVTGAVSCMQPVGDIGYAPGYGYVVRINEDSEAYRQFYNDSSVEDEDWYVVFPTEQEARDFYNGFKTAPDKRRYLMAQPDDRRFSSNDDRDEFDKITELLEPLRPPPNLNETEIPLATPELPQPIPQSPQ